MASVDDILRYTLSGAIDAQDLFNLVFHYIVITGTETDYDAINVAISAALATALGGMESAISSEVVSDTADLFQWDFVDNEFDGKASGVTSALIGTSVSASAPNGICAVMRFATEELRRQARKFIPGMINSNVANDALQSPILSPAIVSAALLNDDIIVGGATIRPCTFNSTPLSPRFETASKFSQASFVNALCGYQRRRQPGAGA